MVSSTDSCLHHEDLLGVAHGEEHRANQGDTFLHWRELRGRRVMGQIRSCARTSLLLFFSLPLSDTLRWVSTLLPYLVYPLTSSFFSCPSEQQKHLRSSRWRVSSVQFAGRASKVPSVEAQDSLATVTEPLSVRTTGTVALHNSTESSIAKWHVPAHASALQPPYRASSEVTFRQSSLSVGFLR